MTVAERSLPALLVRFDTWKRSIIGPRSSRELKGEELSTNQLNSFSYKVLPPTDRDVWLTVVGADTNVTSKWVIETSRDQASIQFGVASDLANSHGNAKVKETYRQMSGWVRNRSAENVIWVYALINAVDQVIQHSIARFLEPEDDIEFEDTRIQIDQSFVRRDEHVVFWREWMRNELMGRMHRGVTFIPDTWRARNHPFIKKYEIHPGLIDLNDLFTRHTGFFQSHKVAGLQIADICAHICYRHHRGEERLPAYWNLRPRIVCRGGDRVTLIHLDEKSLHRDDPKAHVGIFDIEEWKRRADAVRESRSKK